MKKWTRIIVAAFAAYLLMVLLLMISERSAAGTIHNLGDAIWYSVVTMTTVGYGDMYPVTIVGKIIGSIFLLFSLGLLALVVNAIFSLMTGKWLPQLKLWRMRKHTWYIFSQHTQDAEVLSADLLARHPDSLIVLCSCSEPCTAKRITLQTNVLEFIQKYTFAQSERNVFLIGEDESTNRQEASLLTDKNCRIYCKSKEVDSLPNVTFFDSLECCARSYWQKYPLTNEEQRIILIGDGTYAGAIFDQAILVNCMTPFRKVEYQLRGEWQEYIQLHPGLSHIFSPLPDSKSQNDTLSYEKDLCHPEQLENADRIILCSDDFKENAERAINLQRLFAISGNLHVLCDDPTVPGICFGNKSSLFTEELVMKQELDRLAKSMHESYRSGSAGNVPSWKELNSFLKASNRAVADHLPVKAQLLKEYGTSWENRDSVLTELCRRNEHERWSRFHYLHNWNYASVRNNKLRKHPCLVPYEQLSTEEQMKDDFAWDQLLKKEVGKEQN